MYFLQDGTEVSWPQVEEAFNEGKAVIVYQHAENHTASGLMLDGKMTDTRGQCYNIWEEMWTIKPKDLQQCFLVLKGLH